MRKSTTFLALASACIWLQMSPPAAAQNPNAYVASRATAPTVSPYLNLGVNSNGLSNYQTLVRPLLNQREAMARQTTTAEKRGPQSRDGRLVQGAEPRDPNERSGGGRFMNYSHYYSAVR